MNDSPQRTQSSAELNQMNQQVPDAAFRVHSEPGPGLPESAYEQCLGYEPGKRGLQLARQVLLPIDHGGTSIDAGFRIEQLVNGEIIVEIKAVETLLPVHEAQPLTNLKLAGKRLGLLINFNVRPLKHGIRRMVHGL